MVFLLLQNQTLQLAQETIIAGDTTTLNSKITACNTGAVVVSSSALPTGAATEATLANLEGHMTDGSQVAQIKANTAKNGTGTSYSPIVDEDGHLQVDVLSGGGGGTQFAGGDALVTTGTGTAMIGRDVGGVARLVATDTVGNLQMNILTNTDTTKATSTKQDTGNNSLAIIAVNTTSLNANKRPLSNLGTNELAVAVTAGGSAVSASIDTANFGKWSVVCQDNSNNNLYFIIQQSWDGVTWFGDVFTVGPPPTVGNAIETGEANGITSTGFFYFNNSEGLVVDPGGFGGPGSLSQYARYIRIQAYDTGGSGGNFNVYWYQTNSA